MAVSSRQVRFGDFSLLCLLPRYFGFFGPGGPVQDDDALKFRQQLRKRMQLLEKVHWYAAKLGQTLQSCRTRKR